MAIEIVLFVVNDYDFIALFGEYLLNNLYVAVKTKKII